MSKPVLAIATLALTLLCVPRHDAEAAPKTKERPKAAPVAAVTGDPASMELYRKAEALEQAGNAKGAADAYRAVAKRETASTLGARSQRKVGQLLEQSGEVDRAFKEYEEYLSKHPDGDDFDRVVESMYRIAKMFLDGQKRKLFGVPFAPSMSRAEEMFGVILKRAPFSKWSALSQFSLGQCYEKQGNPAEAIGAYQQVIAKYGADPVAADAQYQIGYVLLKESREGSYDRAAAMKAREAFEDFINRYPQSEKVAQARENMKGLEGGQVKSSLDVAKFYDKTRQYKAAVIYYNDVIKQQPGTADAEYAKTRIAALRDQVGEDALRAGPERSETGARAAARRKLQAKVDTISRPDYVGPPVFVPEPKVETAGPARPKLRATPGNIGPVSPVEPPLPDKLPTDDTGLPKPKLEEPDLPKLQ